jgi:hypothetical protein
MEETDAITALRQKRAELVAQVQALHSEIYHVDAAIRLLGGKPRKPQNRFFGPGELIRMIGEAERSGMSAPREIAGYIMKAKGLDQTDKSLVRRIRWGVTDCRKRMAARGA